MIKIFLLFYPFQSLELNKGSTKKDRPPKIRVIIAWQDQASHPYASPISVLMLNSNKNSEIAKGYTPRPWFDKDMLKTLTTNVGKIKFAGIIANSEIENLII